MTTAGLRSAGALSKSSAQSSEAPSDWDANKPCPGDLVAFLPWACRQYNIEQSVTVKRIEKAVEFSIGRIRSKTAYESTMMAKQDVAPDKSPLKPALSKVISALGEETIYVIATFLQDKLISLKFETSVQIPEKLIKILGLVIHFQEFLTHIYMSQGVTKNVCHELAALLPSSYITELCFDGCFVREGVYYLFLEQTSSLRSLSLARCRINDSVLKLIMLKLIYPLPGSKMLKLLDLSSNSITDQGASYIATMLRTNRTLCFLNLGNNRLTDNGAALILETLKIFPMTNDEVLVMKIRYTNYFKRLNELTNAIAQEMALQAEQGLDIKEKAKDKKDAKDKQAQIGKKSALKETKDDAISDAVQRFIQRRKMKISKEEESTEATPAPAVDKAVLERAGERAKEVLGDFEDPFDNRNRRVVNGKSQCLGNNRLSYLNLAYNNLSENTLQLLVEVLEYQEKSGKVPKGLVKLCIEGNPLPDCAESLDKIDKMLIIFDMGKTKQRAASIRKSDKTVRSASRFQ